MDDSIVDEYRDSINDYFDDDLETSISNNGEKMLQKIKLYDNCLPYCEQLELIRVKYLDYLKRNLCHSMLSDNNGYLFLKWMDEFSSYISIYDLAFNKAEHIFLTKLLYNSLTFFQYDYQISKKLMELLSKLLKERRLISRSDLELDWHVLYAFHKNFDDPIHKSSNGNLVKNAQKKELIRLTVHARAYFSKDSTKEMLNEWKQYLCVHAKKYKQYLDYFSLFLPTLLPPEEFEFGFKLWFDDFIDMLNWFQVPPTSLLNLLTRLAEDVHGYIDWEPYLPYFFQKLSPKLDASTQFNIIYYLKLLTWIISPNNIEKNIYYAKKLLLIAKNSRTRFLSKSSSFVSCHLAMLIVQRYKKEQRNLWYNYTPNNYKLDDKTFNEFGAILLENFIDSYFYGTQSQLSYEQLYAIVNLNPELIAEKIPEKLQIAYDQISEPWRLEAILKLYSVSIFPIILDNKIGPKYRIELIPMLFQLIELFNPYDHNLCLIQLFAIKSILILEFPLIDCSSLCNSSDKILTEYETEMCLQSIRLEEFPICFMRCCQNMIDSNNEHLFDNLKKSDSLAIIMFSILTRTTETIAKSFIDNFISFIVSNIYEDGYIVIKIIMESIAMIYPEYMMKKLFPLISEHLNILVLNRDTKLSTCLEKDLRYHIEIFRNLFYCNSELLSNYQDEILILIEKISNLKINSQYFMVYCLLSDLFDNLFTEKIAIDLQKIEPKMMMFENWPKLITTKKFSVKWHQTTTNVLNFAHHLIEIFIKNKLILLEDWIESKSTMTNDELLKNLRLISSVNGLIIDSPKFLSFSLDNSTLYSSNMKNPLLNDLINLNEHIINVINKVLIKLETIKSGDTQSYEEIIYIYYQISKKSSRFQCKKIPKKRLYQCRNKLNEYVWLVHFYSVMIRDASIRINLINTLQKRQNETDICIMKNLLLLSQSNYPTVRYDAEKTLAKIFSHHLDSSKFISNELIDKLNTKNADSLIGVLHLLHCNSDRSLMFCSSWNTLLKLYPILVRINLSEKLEIIDIFDVDFFLLFTDHKFMIPLEKNHSLELLSGYFEEGKSLFFQSITEKEIEEFRQKIIDSNQNNRITYFKLVEQLLTVMRDENLHWRFYHFGFLLLNNLIRNDIDFPLNGIEFLIRNLTNDLQRVRKIAQEVLVKIMYIMLPKKITIKIENLKSIDYDLNCHQNEETYNRQLFLDENHYGYYKHLPFTIEKFDSFENNAQLEILSNEFKNSKFLDMMFTLNSIENGTKINKQNIRFWKLYFILVKMENSEQIFSQILLLFDKHKYNFDKYALEILCGLTKASKHFDYNSYQKFQKFFLIIIEKYFLYLDSESSTFWNELFYSLFNGGDLKRSLWCVEFLVDKTLKSIELSPFCQCEILWKLRHAIRSNWKYPMVSKNIRAYILENIFHSYQKVREIHGILLNYTFISPYGLKSEQVNFDNNYSDLFSLEPIIKQLDEKLSILFDDKKSEMDVVSFKSDLLDPNSDDGKKLLHFIETICLFCKKHDSHSLFEHPGFILILPYLCVIQTNNPIMSQINNAISFIASITYRDEEKIQQVLTTINKLSLNWNWRTRKTILGFLSIFAKSNHFLLMKSKYIDQIEMIIVRLLTDETVEVRTATSTTLSRILENELISGKRLDRLIHLFRSKSSELSSDIANRHGGILGLCSIVYAFPKEIPDFLPEILLFLIDYTRGISVISNSVNEALRFFKKYHIEDWIIHKHKFSAEQLYQLNDVLISPSYYC